MDNLMFPTIVGVINVPEQPRRYDVRLSQAGMTTSESEQGQWIKSGEALAYAETIRNNAFDQAMQALLSISERPGLSQDARNRLIEGVDRINGLKRENK